MIIDRIKYEIEKLEHRVDMMKKRADEVFYEMLVQFGEESYSRRLELVELQAKIQEDEKFIKFLKELVHKE